MGIKEVIIGDWTFRQIKRHFTFEKKEIKDFHISVFLMSLMFFFFIWVFTNLNVTTAILTWIYCWIITAISMYAFISVPKLTAITRGNIAKYEGWTNGLLMGFIISFLSYGIIPLVTPGYIDVEPIERLKHGKQFHYETRKDIFMVSFMAPITSLIISLFAQFLFFITNIRLIYYIAIINAIIAFFSMIPLANNVGITIFYMKKKVYFPMLIALFLFMITTIFTLKYPYLYKFSIIVGILGVLIGTYFSKKIKFVEHILK